MGEETERAPVEARCMIELVRLPHLYDSGWTLYMILEGRGKGEGKKLSTRHLELRPIT
jgi:hypothetical protein